MHRTGLRRIDDDFTNNGGYASWHQDAHRSELQEMPRKNTLYNYTRRWRRWDRALTQEPKAARMHVPIIYLVCHSLQQISTR